mgnify:CR=1 FL=1|tara:strand:- start:27756 stop:28649 length:894 start_codon:yes stop_codon:yes gene_type:complete
MAWIETSDGRKIGLQKSGLIAKLTSLCKQLTPDYIERAILKFEGKDANSFGYGESTTYDLFYEGMRYPPKAIFGLALEEYLSAEIIPSYFQGGEHSTCFKVLRRNGFQIIKKEAAGRDEHNDELLDQDNFDFSGFTNEDSLPPTDNKKQATPPHQKKSKEPDWDATAKRNRAVGTAGEIWVLEEEKKVLEEQGKRELAANVKHVALTDPSAGYDIKSFENDGTEKYIEVKTTFGDKNRPFPITANEVEVSKKLKDKYWIYRIHSVKLKKGQVSMYKLQGPVDEQFELTPILYGASKK